MIAGSIVSAIASGLMVKYYVNTSTGYCMMVPQTILEGEDISIGTSVIMFAETISGTVFLSVCQNVFENKLIRELRQRVPTADPRIVLESGASSLVSTMSKLYPQQVVEKVLEAYSKALQPIWIITVVLGSLSLFGAVCTEWVSVKKDKDKKHLKDVDENVTEKEAQTSDT